MNSILAKILIAICLIYSNSIFTSSAQAISNQDSPSASTSDDSSNDKLIRFHMWDGSIVAGKLSIEELTVKTEFGMLNIPIKRIKSLHPGLNSFPELKTKLDELVEGLGAKDFSVREKSQKELTNMGLQIRNQLRRFSDGGSAERKKRLAEIKKSIDELVDEMAEEGENTSVRELIPGDMVVTPQFSIVGKIQQDEFTVASKFGELRVKLSDIQKGERKFEQKAEDIRKTVSVGAEAFFQRKPESTRIRVNRGDKIKIRASGIVQWTNWSSSSTPDGMSGQGQYRGINSGTLCARIGSNGKIVKIGSDGDFVAKKSGVLYLGVAMQDNYLQSSGYRWTGNYKAKIHIMPTTEKN